jgi:hypothetical protein
MKWGVLPALGKINSRFQIRLRLILHQVDGDAKDFQRFLIDIEGLGGLVLTLS